MTRRKQKPPKDDAAKPGVRSVVVDFLKAVVVGSSTLIIGALALWLSPVKGCVTHRLWKEKAQINVTVDSVRITVGDEIGINVLLSPGSQLDVAEGVLSVNASPYVEVTPKQIKTPIVVSPTPIGDPTFRVRAVSPGLAELVVVLQTRYGKYSKDLKLHVDARTNSSRASWGDFSGFWSVVVGPYFGEMELHETGTRFDGTYYFRGGHEAGFVEGFRDGTEFHAVFIRKGGSPYRWKIESSVDEGTKLELKGSATLHELRGGELLPPRTSVKFYAAPR